MICKQNIPATPLVQISSYSAFDIHGLHCRLMGDLPSLLVKGTFSKWKLVYLYHTTDLVPIDICDPFWENPPKRGDVNYSLARFLSLMLSFGHFF